MKNLESVTKEDIESGKDYTAIMKENLDVLKKLYQANNREQAHEMSCACFKWTKKAGNIRSF